MEENLIREISDLANGVIDAQWDITQFEALQIAVKIQQNKILSDVLALAIKFQRTYKQSQQD